MWLRLLTCVVAIVIGITIYLLLRKYLPRFTAIVTGGRIQRAKV